jgi:hypothetical protein
MSSKIGKERIVARDQGVASAAADPSFESALPPFDGATCLSALTVLSPKWVRHGGPTFPQYEPGRRIRGCEHCLGLSSVGGLFVLRFEMANSHPLVDALRTSLLAPTLELREILDRARLRDTPGRPPGI